MTIEGLPVWIKGLGSNKYLLSVLAQPKASRTQIVGPHGEPARLKVQVAAPPVEGEANEELVRFFKKLFGKGSSVLLVRGQTGRQKDFEVSYSGDRAALLKLLGVT